MPINASDTIPEMLWRDLRWLEEHPVPTPQQGWAPTTISRLVQADTVVAELDPALAAEAAEEPELTCPKLAQRVAVPGTERRRLRHCAECQEQTASRCIACGRPLCSDHGVDDCSGCKADAQVQTRRKLVLAACTAIGLSLAAILGVFGMLMIIAREWLATWSASAYLLVSVEISSVIFFLVFAAVGVAELVGRRREFRLLGITA